MSVFKIIGYVLSLAYPFFIFLSLTVLHLPVRLVGLLVMLFASAMFISKTGNRNRLIPLVMGLIAFVVLITNSEVILRFYPVFVNMIFLFTFLLSLRNGDSIIFHFATMGDRNIKWNGGMNEIRRYCCKVTYVWLCFFVFNICMALGSIFFEEGRFWVIWNGFLSYIAMGLLFAVEFVVRTIKQKRDSEPVLMTRMKDDSRPDDYIVAYCGKWKDADYKYWKDFREDTSAIRHFLESRRESKVMVHADDFWYFLVCLTAVLESDRTALVSSNISSDFVSSVVDEDTLILFDTPSESGYLIQDILVEYGDMDIMPIIDISEEARVFLYTSGSTGKPKSVEHFFKELEYDNDCLGKYWRGVFQKKIEVSSVNPHHAFGIVFAALKPFIYGIPVRRERIESPAEIASLDKEKYLFITSPAFLTVSLKDPSLYEPIHLNDPFIINAGGPLSREKGTDIERIYGIRPLDIYGSTETGALAWRINRDSESEWWTPMTSVRARLEDDGCLSVKADAVHGNEEFHTADLAELRDDGRFILKGRKDSIVKIAEKRISLDEVAGRIMATGLISDTKVILIKGKQRDYLGAVVVLSSEGRAQIEGKTSGECFKIFRHAVAGYLEGVTIPRKWRIVDQIPQNNMGKIQMDKVRALLGVVE